MDDMDQVVALMLLLLLIEGLRKYLLANSINDRVVGEGSESISNIICFSHINFNVYCVWL